MLEELGLHRSAVDDEGLRFVGQINSLKSLDLTSTAITSNGLAQLGRLSNLRSLRIDECRLDSRALDGLMTLQSLEILNLRASAIPANGLVGLQELPSLKTLHAGGLDIDLRAARSIGKLSKLADLSLDASTISDAGIARLSMLTNLRALDLSGTQVTDIGVESLHNFRELRSLDLSGTAITDVTLERISRWMPHLGRLNVSETAVTDAGMTQLARLQQLESLDFCETQAQGACYDQLRSIPSMKYLSHSELPLLRRRRNVVRFADVDFALHGRRCTLNLNIELQPDRVVRSWQLEINCRREGVPSYMQPAHINGPPLMVDFVDWRNLEGQEFKLLATTEPLGNLYIGWHHFANRHHIRFGRRKGPRFRLRWVGWVHSEDFVVDPRSPGSHFVVDGIVRLGTVRVRDSTTDAVDVKTAFAEAVATFTPSELGDPAISGAGVMFPITVED